MSMMGDPYARAQGPQVGRRGGLPMYGTGRRSMYGPLVEPEAPVTPPRPYAERNPWAGADSPVSSPGMMSPGGMSPRLGGSTPQAPWTGMGNYGALLGGAQPASSGVRPSPVGPAVAGAAGSGNRIIALGDQYNQALAVGDVATANQIWLQIMALQAPGVGAAGGQGAGSGGPFGSVTSSGLGLLG